VGAIGVLEGAGPLLLASLVALSYGAPIVPILGGAIVGLPQVVGGLALIRSSRAAAMTKRLLATPHA
jgi:hypothetical protein